MRILILGDDHCYSKCFGHLENDKLVFAKPTEKFSEYVKQQMKCDKVIHTGDYENKREWVEKFADWYVDGNQDKQRVNLFQEIKIKNKTIYLIHGDKCFRKTPSGWIFDVSGKFYKEMPDFIIYGHSHLQECINKNWPVQINPGSLNFPRQKNVWCHQWAVLEINENNYCVELWGLKKDWNPNVDFGQEYEKIVCCKQIRGVF